MIIIGFLSGAIGAVGSIASTILGNRSASKEAQANRDWQEQMSNTSISRRMSDLRNAGLNPLLATDNASAGASTPSGSQAQLTKADPSWIMAMSSAKLQKEQANTQRAETKAIEAQTKAQEQENGLFEVRARKLELETRLEEQRILTEQTIQKLNNANSLDAKARVLVNAAQERNIKMSIEEAKRNIQLLDAKTDSLENTGLGQDVKFISDITSNPARLVGAIIGGLGSASARGIKALFNNRKNINESKVRK